MFFFQVAEHLQGLVDGGASLSHLATQQVSSEDRGHDEEGGVEVNQLPGEWMGDCELHVAYFEIHCLFVLLPWPSSKTT